MKISVGIVAYNEEQYLKNILNDLENQSYDHEKLEILLIDSMSTDNTLKIMENFKRQPSKFYDIKIIENKKQKQATGWNLAIAEFSGEALIRLDAHAKIAKDFIEMNVYYLEKGENIVGGLRPTVSLNGSKWSKTLLIAESSLFGSSIADYRHANVEKYVNSMFHACYRREVFEKVGMFNEFLGRTEDNEFHYRVRKAGYKLYFNSNILSYQYIRSSFGRMIKQKWSNGYWIGLTVAVTPQCFSLYHFVPGVFVLGLIILSIIGIFSYAFPIYLLSIIYFIVNITMSLFSFFNKDANLTTLLLPFVFMILHLSYGIGTLEGLVYIPFWKNLKFAKEKRTNEL